MSTEVKMAVATAEKAGASFLFNRFVFRKIAVKGLPDEYTRNNGHEALKHWKMSRSFNEFKKEFPLLDHEWKGAQYITRGKGDNVIVALPGLFESPYGHAHLLALADKGYRVVIPDYSTFDYSATEKKSPHDPATLQDFSRGMDKFLNSFGKDAHITLIGTSLGGLLMQHYMAQKHTAHIERQVFIQTAAVGSEALLGNARLELQRKVSEILPTEVIRRAFHVGYVADIPLPHEQSLRETVESVAKGFVHYAMKMYQHTLPHAKADILRRLALAASTYVPETDGTQDNKPVLIIENRYDRTFPPKKSGMKDRFPGAKVVDLLSRARHRASKIELKQILGEIIDFVPSLSAA